MNTKSAFGRYLAMILLALTLPASGAVGQKQLSGHVPKPVPNLTAIGRLAADKRLDLAIGLPLRNATALTNLLSEIYNPDSPRFHQYLTVEQFTAQFGPSIEQYAAVTDYLGRNGFTVNATHPNRLVLDVSGTVADIERTFGVSLRIYRHPARPRTFFAPDAEPSVDASLAILDICGLDDYEPPHPIDLRPADTNSTVTSFATGSGPGGNFIGYDFRAAYAPGVNLTGVGQVIGLFEFGPYYTNDITLYEQIAGLPKVGITNVLLDGFTGIPTASTDDGEEVLDIQMAMSMAPGATILVYEGNSAIDIFNRMATDNKAKQISCSFGFLPAPATMDSVFAQFAAQGQTMFVASGDGGSYSATANIFAPTDDPNITCVGGTSLTTLGPRGAWASETTWIGSGGGVSRTYGIPSYQQGLSMTANHGSGSFRNIPDVAMLADTIIFTVNENGSMGGIGGTSAAAPLWAGFMALVNQQAVANGRATIGNFNPAVYAIGKGANFTACFHDITTGNNFNTATPTNYSAVTGYDLCTGWGSPTGSNFINTLAAPTDALHITPGTGFSQTAPYGISFNSASLDFSLTNAGVNSLDWALGTTSVWLNVSANNGTLPPASDVVVVTASLNTDATSNLVAGTYLVNLWFTNLSTHVVQSRLFTLTVSSADFPIGVTGFNAKVVVPRAATTANPQATGFDIANNICFYEAGLNTNPQVSGTGGTQGFPQGGQFVSHADGLTTFQLGQYGATNALLMGAQYPATKVLTLSNPAAYDSLTVLASSANGGGSGTLVVHFADGTSSQSFNFNAQDWFNTTSNVALQGFGRLDLSAGLQTENNGASNPNLYQTKVNLAGLGLNQPVSSITFTKPSAAGDTGVFAVSGSLMPPQVNLTQSPQSTTNSNPAVGVTFSVTAMGAPPLAYQWYNGGTPIPGQTLAKLTLAPPLQTTDAGNYYVTVTNAFNAATSSVATLTVYRAPVITQQPSPTNLMLFAGANATFTVAAAAAPPLNYFWLFNGSPIAGAIAPTYSQLNLQPASSGNYSVLLSNAFGMATSSIVSLTVLIPANPYVQKIIADHPLAYYRLDEQSGSTAFDFMNGRNGQYLNVRLGRPGYNAFDPDTAAGFGSLSSVNSYVGGIPIDFATAGNAAFSIEAWVKGTAQNNDNGVITKGTGGGGEQFNLDTGGGSHAYRFFVRDASTGNAHLANGTIGPNGAWQHVVGVCNEAGGTVTLYVNGVANASGTITASTGIITSQNAMTIGSRQSGTGATYDLQFVGTIDEVAIYNYALTTAQVQKHFSAGTNPPPVTLIVEVLNPTQLRLTWPGGALQSAATADGPYADVMSATSPYIVAPGGTQQFFRVKVQ